MSILQASLLTFYSISKKIPQNILYGRQKHKSLFIISKVSMFTSRVCSSLSFTALTAVTGNSSSST